MIGKPHILSVTDVQRGIQAVAAFLLGDASLWTELVQVNNLSPPYMTLDPSEVYGPSLSSAVLATPLSQGVSQITLPRQPQSTNRLYIAYSGPGGVVAESVGVRSYDGTTFQLATPLIHSYPPGAFVQMFAAYIVGNVTVLLPGGTLYVPVSGASANFNINNQSQLVDVFGADLAWPLSFGVSGDLATVTGVDCAQQRFTSAIQTDLNSLPLHLDFGSQLRSRIGTSSLNTPWEAFVRESLVKLPEVTDVRNAQAVKTGDGLSISGADVYVPGSDTPVPLSAVVINST